VKLFTSPFTLMAVIAISFIFNLFYNAWLPIHADEAYYWTWAKTLELGYFDHPPLIAYMIHLTTLFSDHVFFIRLVAIITVFGSLYYLVRIAYELYGKEAGVITGIIFLLLPPVQLSLTVTTPDSPLILFLSAGLYYGLRAYRYEHTKDIYLTGLFMGLMLLAKLTGILFWGAFGLFVLLKKRSLLTNIHTYLALLIALGTLSGFLYWNSQNEWISFGYQLAHGTSKTATFRPEFLGQFIGGFILLMTPIYFIMLIDALLKQKKNLLKEGNDYLLFMALFILLFFGYKALFKKMELNWFAPALLPLIPFLAGYISHFKPYKRMLFGSLLALILVLVIKFPSLFLPPKANHFNFFFGYQEAIERLKPHIKPDDVICSDYQTSTALLHYYLQEFPNSISNVLRPRQSQYEIWEKQQPPFNKCLGWIRRSKFRKHHHEHCEQFSEIEHYTLKQTHLKDQHYMIFRCDKVTP